MSAKSGHINVHETGAIDSTGHKVLSLQSNYEKISAVRICTSWATTEDAVNELIFDIGRLS